MTILEKLYDGEIIPSETAVPGTEEYRESCRRKPVSCKVSERHCPQIGRSYSPN